MSALTITPRDDFGLIVNYAIVKNERTYADVDSFENRGRKHFCLWRVKMKETERKDV
jgi:hypothetical protein